MQISSKQEIYNAFFMQIHISYCSSFIAKSNAHFWNLAPYNNKTRDAFQEGNIFAHRVSTFGVLEKQFLL